MEQLASVTGFERIEKKDKTAGRQYTSLVLILVTALGMGICLQNMFLPDISKIPTVFVMLLTGSLLWVVGEKRHAFAAMFGSIVILTVLVAVVLFSQWGLGALTFLNRFLVRYNYATGLAIDYFTVPEGVDASFGCSVFFATFLVVLTIYITLLIRGKHPLFLLVFWLPLIGGSIFLETSIGGVLVGVAVLSVIGAFAYSQTELQKDAVYALTILALGIVLATAGGVYFHVSGFSASETMAEMKKNLVARMETARYGEYDYSQGDLGKAVRSSEEIRLQVTMERPETMYLRGYVAGSFADGQWSGVDSVKYSGKYEGMIESYGKNQFHPLAQLERFLQMNSQAAGGQVPEEMQVTLRNKGASRKYTYLPYGIDYESLSALGQTWQDAYMPGTSSQEAEDNIYDAVVAVRNWESLVGSDASWIFADTDVTEESGHYRSAEADYRNFVYENYMEVEDAYQEETDRWSDWDRGDLISVTKKVRETVREKGEENWHSAHYSTIAVFLFRAIGVPARYVEGYIVDGSRAKRTAEGIYTVEVLAKDAHAWVEIYKDGIGWLPIEVTPDFYEELTGEDQQMEQTAGSAQSTAGGEEEDQEEGEEQAAPGMAVNLWFVLGVIAAVIVGLVILALLILCIRRAVILKDKQKGWESGELFVRLGAVAASLGEVYDCLKRSEDQLPQEITDTLREYHFSPEARNRIDGEDVKVMEDHVQTMWQEFLEKAGLREKLVAKYVLVVR